MLATKLTHQSSTNHHRAPATPLALHTPQPFSQQRTHHSLIRTSDAVPILRIATIRASLNTTSSACILHPPTAPFHQTPLSVRVIGTHALLSQVLGAPLGQQGPLVTSFALSMVLILAPIETYPVAMTFEYRRARTNHPIAAEVPTALVVDWVALCGKGSDRRGTRPEVCWETYG